MQVFPPDKSWPAKILSRPLAWFYFRNVCSDGRFCSITVAMIEHADFSVVVKNRARPPKPWRWEIYRAGRTSPIEHSEIYFESMTEANRAGKVALRLLLSEYQS